MSEALSTGEFERWSEIDQKFKERVLDHIDNQAIVNATFNSDIALLKAAKPKEMARNSILSAIIAGIVTGTVGIFK